MSNAVVNAMPNGGASMKSSKMMKSNGNDKDESKKAVSALTVLSSSRMKTKNDQTQAKKMDEHLSISKSAVDRDAQARNESKTLQTMKTQASSSSSSSGKSRSPNKSVPSFSETLDVKSDDIENNGFMITDEFPVVVEGLSTGILDGVDSTDNVTIDVSEPPAIRRGQMLLNMSVVTNDIRLDNDFIHRLASCYSELSCNATRPSDWHLYSAGRFAQGLVQLEFYVVVQRKRAGDIIQMIAEDHGEALKNCTKVPDGGNLFTSRRPVISEEDSGGNDDDAWWWWWWDVVSLILLAVAFVTAISTGLCVCFLLVRRREQRRFRRGSGRQGPRWIWWKVRTLLL